MEAEAKQFVAAYPKFSEKIGEKFTSGHWDEPNVLAHMRVNDRTLPSGERALHVEEWQSDWAAANRKGGIPEVDANHNVSYPKKPSHPLVDNWQDLMARRTLKEAADGGYDRVTWITGQQTADRYDLSKTFKEISYFKNKEGKYDLHGLFVQGGAEDAAQIASGVPESKLADHVGKDVAKKIANNEGNLVPGGDGKYLSGLDLKVGGEWATKLYDESMVNRFNKIGKKYGVQVEKTKISQGSHLIDDGTKIGYRDAVTVHSIKITPEMRKAIGATKFHPFADLP
jgi:hypothetical protein